MKTGLFVPFVVGTFCGGVCFMLGRFSVDAPPPPTRPDYSLGQMVDGMECGDGKTLNLIASCGHIPLCQQATAARP